MGIENFLFLMVVTLALLWNGEASLSCAWTPSITVAQDDSSDHLAINDALQKLQSRDPRKSRSLYGKCGCVGEEIQHCNDR
ncbi:unnamed protein product [Arabis nemorensis]|uniref:Uncharacterized protein n=1 Tax=Arabis nemorensis TaxID=586526 RepID=A0A565B7F3_9BRAS|nr:unnamed protein product [Arabis nemorensis]